MVLSKGKWSKIKDKLADPVYMAKLGGVIPTSVALLKKNKRRSERSKQPKCSDPDGQLDISSRKVVLDFIESVVIM